MRGRSQVETSLGPPNAACLLLVLVTVVLRVAAPNSTTGEEEDGTRTRPPPDKSCSSSWDCEIKDVGGCCGSQPMCVNQGFQPEAGLSKEALNDEDCKGAVSVCGHQDIEHCSCDPSGSSSECRRHAGPDPLVLLLVLGPLLACCCCVAVYIVRARGSKDLDGGGAGGAINTISHKTT